MNTDPTNPEQPGVLRWRDAQGHTWELWPTPDQLIVSGAEEQFAIPRREWDSRINYNDVPGGTVFRLDSGTREVGFMVSEQQAEALLAPLGWSHADAVASTQRVVAVSQRQPLWQTMTPWVIGGLLAAGAAFWPVVGYGFAIVALFCMIMAYRQARGNDRLKHVRIALIVTGVILLASVSTSTLSTYMLLTGANQSAAELRMVNVPPPEFSNPSKLLAVLIVLLALSVHECAHALVAWWCGDLGPLQRGRVTLNPLAHIDPLGTVLVPAMLAYWGGIIFGWARPVMVSLHGVPNPRRANILISAAGPFSNLLLGLIFLMLFLALGCIIGLWIPQARVAHYSILYYDVVVQGFAGAPLIATLATVFKWGFFINFLLCFFNLLPLPPLDGAHVLGSLFPGTFGQLFRRLGPYAIIVFAALLFTGILRVVLLPALLFIDASSTLVGLATGLSAF